MNADKSVSWIYWAFLLFLSIIWGSSFILMKKGLAVFTSTEVGALRLGISFVCMAPIAWVRMRKIDRPSWKYIALVGWMGSGFPAFLFALAQTHISSAIAGILNSLTPIFTLIIGMLFFGLPFRWGWVAGILIGLSGVVMIIGQLNGWAFHMNGWYALAALGGTVCYAISGNTVKKHLTHIDALTIGSVGFVLTGIPAVVVLFGLQFPWRYGSDPGFWPAMGYISLLAVFGTVFASVLYYFVVQRTNQVFGSLVSYIIPVVALGWGFMDGEVIHWIFLAGFLMILIGVYTARRS